jgi:hypothetical protein
MAQREDVEGPYFRGLLDPTSADQMLASGSNEARRYPTFRDAFPSGIEGEAAAYRCFGRQTRGHGGVAAQAL